MLMLHVVCTVLFVLQLSYRPLQDRFPNTIYGCVHDICNKTPHIEAIIFLKDGSFISSKYSQNQTEDVSRHRFLIAYPNL